MMTFLMPTIYPKPFGGPLYWRDETSGVLADAVGAYLDERVGQGGITPEQLEIVRSYCDYYINAPCWRHDGAEEDFATLLASIKTVQTPSALHAWLLMALEVGIDPL